MNDPALLFCVSFGASAYRAGAVSADAMERDAAARRAHEGLDKAESEDALEQLFEISEDPSIVFEHEWKLNSETSLLPASSSTFANETNLSPGR